MKDIFAADFVVDAGMGIPQLKTIRDYSKIEKIDETPDEYNLQRITNGSYGVILGSQKNSYWFNPYECFQPLLFKADSIIKLKAGEYGRVFYCVKTPATYDFIVLGYEDD